MPERENASGVSGYIPRIPTGATRAVGDTNMGSAMPKNQSETDRELGALTMTLENTCRLVESLGQKLKPVFAERIRDTERNNRDAEQEPATVLCGRIRALKGIAHSCNEEIERLLEGVDL